MTPRGSFAVLFAVTSLLTSRASAVEIGSEGDLTSLEVHAFASQGFLLTSSNNYIDTSSKNGSFQFSEIGINFTKSLTDKLRFGLQLDAQDFGTTGNYNVKADWFYGDYRFTDWFGIRVGRVKIPFGLYNEINDVDSARAFVLLPQSVYPVQSRDYLLAQTGGEIYGYVRMGGAGALDYRAYGGTIYFSTNQIQIASPFQIVAVNVPFLVGGRLLWETPLEGLRVGGSVQTLRIDTDILLQAQPLNLEIPATLWIASAEYAHHDLLLAAEYSRWYVKEDSSNARIVPSAPIETSERAYGLATYRVNKWLQPGAYYSVYFPNVDHRDRRADVQHDLAATLRFDINPYWLVKVEGHYMAGTAGLTSTLNGGLPPSQLERYWGVFLAKTTVYF
ncbi:MAG TPA: hypothetical protein VGI39_45955 [Polyangiaceae bacterium]